MGLPCCLLWLSIRFSFILRLLRPNINLLPRLSLLLPRFALDSPDHDTGEDEFCKVQAAHRPLLVVVVAELQRCAEQVAFILEK